MGLLELLFERHNPGPVGEVEFRGGRRGDPTWLPVRVLIAGLAVAGAAYVSLADRIDWIDGGLKLGGWFIYAVAAYWIRPRPDYTNIGIAGTPIDHPFRWSDDANRILVFLQILFWPGRFVAETTLDVWHFVRTFRTP